MRTSLLRDRCSEVAWAAEQERAWSQDGSALAAGTISDVLSAAIAESFRSVASKPK